LNSIYISDKQISQIRQIPHFQKSIYANIDISSTLEYYKKRFIKHSPLFTENSIANLAVADIGCGYGWLAMAIALFTDVKKIIAIDYDEERLKAASQISEILGLKSSITWLVGSVTDIPLDSMSVDICYCIEVIEHVNRNPDSIRELCRITRNYLLITTPNLYAPIIGHDTRLPFCHWLPIPLRKIYARVFLKSYSEHNKFWSPVSLMSNMVGFKRISTFLHYSSLRDYLSQFPYYSPYSKKMVYKPSLTTCLYMQFASKVLGRNSHWFLPNLAGLFKRV